MKADLVIDDLGKTWSTYSMDLGYQSGYALTRSELPNYLTKNLGYVRLKGRDDRLVIMLRPTVVSDHAVIALLYYLADQHFSAIALQIFDDHEDDWRYELVGGHASAIEKISSLLAHDLKHQNSSSFLSREVALDTIDSMPPLRDGLDFFRYCGGRLDSRQIASFTSQLTGRHMLYSVSPDSESITLKSIVGSFPTPIETYLYNAVGRDIRDRPDTAYAQECVAAYRSVAKRGKPTCFEVDAITKWSASTKRLRRRYRRIILPFSDEGGQLWLLGQSMPDGSISLRATAA